ncbi:hypothetical protein [Paenibacillus hamazuiensis]|uniref:hypothetical protein n=1 Tax=Paenibacillus hamazuiensis TaxID=2936508 RepID=UPI00200DBE2A|nr:hypothetical protein [Paenibacillus hamazuiensis]
MQSVKKADVRKLVGKRIYALKKDGTMVSGKLVRIQGNALYLAPVKGGKTVRTSAFIPLVLFDLLAIGTLPFAYGGGFGFGGYPYGGGFGFGYPGGFIW